MKSMKNGNLDAMESKPEFFEITESQLRSGGFHAAGARMLQDARRVLEAMSMTVKPGEKLVMAVQVMNEDIDVGVRDPEPFKLDVRQIEHGDDLQPVAADAVEKTEPVLEYDLKSNSFKPVEHAPDDAVQEGTEVEEVGTSDHEEDDIDDDETNDDLEEDKGDAGSVKDEGQDHKPDDQGGVVDPLAEAANEIEKRKTLTLKSGNE